jgi:hypothetical protein
VFCQRLEDGGGDEVLSLLRKSFDASASILRRALATVDIPNDPQAFIETASPAQLTAWQSVKPAVARLDRVAAVARIFGPADRSRWCRTRAPKTPHWSAGGSTPVR